MKSIGEETLAGPGIDIDCFVLENLFSLEIKINTINVSKVPHKTIKPVVVCTISTHFSGCSLFI